MILPNTQIQIFSSPHIPLVILSASQAPLSPLRSSQSPTPHVVSPSSLVITVGAWLTSCMLQVLGHFVTFRLQRNNERHENWYVVEPLAWSNNTLGKLTSHQTSIDQQEARHRRELCRSFTFLAPSLDFSKAKFPFSSSVKSHILSKYTCKGICCVLLCLVKQLHITSEVITSCLASLPLILTLANLDVYFTNKALHFNPVSDPTFFRKRLGDPSICKTSLLLLLHLYTSYTKNKASCYGCLLFL